MADLIQKEHRDLRAEAKRWDAIWWAGAFIWIGLALAAESFDILPDIGDAGEWWPWIFIGLGPWSLILNSYRLMSDAPNPSTWDWVWTLIFVGMAIGSLTDVAGEIVGAAVLIGIGGMILSRTFARTE